MSIKWSLSSLWVIFLYYSLRVYSFRDSGDIQSMMIPSRVAEVIMAVTAFEFTAFHFCFNRVAACVETS